jgi:GTPase
VRDIASPDTEAQAEDVRRVLADLGAGPEVGQPLIEIWNKIDLLDGEDRGAILARAKRLHDGAPAAIPVSAVSGEETKALVRVLAESIDEGSPVEAHVAAGDGRALAWLYRHGRILRRAEDGEGGLRLAVRLDPKALGRFERLFPEALVGLAAE